MKRFLLVGCLLAVLGPTLAQTQNLPQIEVWPSKVRPLPPSFALSIPYKGTERVMFSRTMADSTADGYWSYLFAWDIAGAIATNPDSLRRQLIAYYNGYYLAFNNQPPAGYNAFFTQVRITPNARWPKDKASFTGKVYTYNYLTGRQLDLLLKVHQRSSSDGKRTLLLFEASPKPYTHTIWQALDSQADIVHIDTRP